MDLSTSEKIRQNLGSREVRPKEACDWNQSDDTEQLMITLKELQLSLEN